MVIDRLSYNQQPCFDREHKVDSSMYSQTSTARAMPQQLPQQTCAHATGEYKVKSEPASGCNIEAASSVTHDKLIELIRAVQPGVAITFSIKLTEPCIQEVHLPTSTLDNSVEEVHRLLQKAQAGHVT